MTIQIYNSLTRQKEAFEPLAPPNVTFYSCGPTVYGAFHVGNARTFVLADVIRRWLKRYYHVTYAQNITDVDDKIINRAREEGVAPEELAEKYTNYFFEKLAQLGNLPADYHPRATQHIGAMIGLIKKLVDKDHAYVSEDGSVWFDVSSDPDYGKLSRMSLDQMQQGERLDDEQQRLKRSPLDFCLWKAAKEGEPAWNSPWGKGRPGWHIECSCMSMKVLGRETIDIHSGGQDLRFPHHENEIAQSESATGKPFVRYWIHQGLLDIEGEKMSKSLGNIKDIDDVLEKVQPLTLRYFLMSARYRDKLDFSDDNIRKCQSAAERMVVAGREANRLLKGQTNGSDWEKDEQFAALWREFATAMDDDFNTPRALAALLKTVTLLNTICANVEKEDGDLSGLQRASSLLQEMREALGLGRSLEKEDSELDAELTEQLRELVHSCDGTSPKELADKTGAELVEQLISLRADARKAKNFDLADEIRDKLAALGIILQDKPGETIWQRG